MTRKETIKRWIIDMLDKTNMANFDHNLGVICGMERILNRLYNFNTDTDKSIHDAYLRMDERLYSSHEQKDC